MKRSTMRRPRWPDSTYPVSDEPGTLQLGVSEATFYIWKKKYAHLGVAELRQLRSLEDENARLKRLVADLSLDKHILTAALRKLPEARPVPRAGRPAELEAQYYSQANVA